MLYFQLPHKHRFLSVFKSFKLDFSNGIFSARGEKKLFNMDKNTIYHLERFSVSANIPEDEYTNALDYESGINIPFPQIELKLKNGVQQLSPVPILNFYRDKNIGTPLFTQTANDELILKFNGALTQTSALIERENVSMCFLFEMYAVDSNEYNKNFRLELDKNYGEGMRK